MNVHLTAGLQPFVILLAEDEPADAHLVKAALTETGVVAELHHVRDGREAFEFLRRQGPRFSDAPRPDLILLDLNMPRMDGREFLTAIKQEPDFSDIPVVILTTSEAERDIVASYNLGAAGYVTKPADIQQFIAAIHQLGDYWIKLVRLPHHN
ncbi:response regulator [Propionivibrio sp.]|uniref:response regulator n=1 Tax=Propionivibrio sp. TaxID=2212460 RepID=UPI003BF2458B